MTTAVRNGGTIDGENVKRSWLKGIENVRRDDDGGRDDYSKDLGGIA